MIDIVRPKGNELAFVEMAKELGYDSLVFLYGSKDKVPSFNGINESDFPFFIARLDKGKKCLVCANDATKVRMLVEGRGVHLLFGIENQEKQDHSHFRNSGLTQVEAKLAFSKGKIIAFDFSLLLNASSHKRAILMGRMMQNVRICRKYKVSLAICSFATTPYGMRAPLDLLSFGREIGLDSVQLKKVLSNVEDCIENL